MLYSRVLHGRYSVLAFARCALAFCVVVASFPSYAYAQADSLAPVSVFSEEEQLDVNGTTRAKKNRDSILAALAGMSAHKGVVPLEQKQFDDLVAALDSIPWERTNSVLLDSEMLEEKRLAMVIEKVIAQDRNLRLKPEHVQSLTNLCEYGRIWGSRFGENIRIFLRSGVYDDFPSLLDATSFSIILGDLKKDRTLRNMQEIRGQMLGLSAAENSELLDQLLFATRESVKFSEKKYLAYALGVAACKNSALLEKIKEVLKSHIGLMSIDISQEGKAEDTASAFAEGLLSRMREFPFLNPPGEVPVMQPRNIKLPIHNAGSLEELLPGMTFVRAQGRTLLYRNAEGHYVGVKILRQDEDPAILDYEQCWLDYVQAYGKSMGMEGTYPRGVRFEEKRIARVQVMQGEAVEALRNQRNSDGNSIALNKSQDGYTLMAYEIPDDNYFRYLNDPSLSPKEFQEFSKICLNDLFCLARHGIIHTVPLDLFHSLHITDRMEHDRGHFLTLMDIVYPSDSRGVGNLRAWLKNVGNHNWRVKALADFAEVFMFSDLLREGHPMSAHLQTLSGEHPEYSKAPIYLASFLADNFLAWSLLLASHGRERGELDWYAPDELARSLREGFDQAFESFTGMPANTFVMGDAVDWTKAARQLAYVTAKGDEYADDMELQSIPKEIFNLPDHAIAMSKDARSARNWVDNPERHGWYRDGVNADIGFTNGAFFPQELVKAWTLYSAGMILVAANITRPLASLLEKKENQSMGPRDVAGDARVLLAGLDAPKSKGFLEGLRDIATHRSGAEAVAQMKELFDRFQPEPTILTWEEAKALFATSAAWSPVMDSFVGLLHIQQEAAQKAGVEAFQLDPVGKVVWGAKKDPASGAWQRDEKVRLGPMPPMLQAALQVRPTEIWQNPVVIEQGLSPLKLGAIAENLLDPLLDNRIAPVAEDEIVLGANHLPEYFWGNRKELSQEARAMLSGAEKISQNALAIGEGESLIVPIRRRSGKQTVYVIKKADVERYAKHSKRYSKAQVTLLQPDEVVLSSIGLGAYFHVHNATLDAALAEYKKVLEKQTEGPLMIGDIPCYRRYSGKNLILAMKSADVPKLAAKLPFEAKGHETSPTQIACTGYLLCRFFQADKSTLNDVLAKRLPDPVTTSRGSIQISGITFVKGFSGKQPAWVMEIADIRKLGRYWKLKLKHAEIADGEFACTGGHMAERFSWETADQEKQARAKLPDPYRSDASEMYHGDAHFVKRWVGSARHASREFRLEWVAKTSEMREAANYLGLKPILFLPPLGDAEIAVSKAGIASLYVGNAGEIANHIKVKAQLPKLELFADLEYTSPQGIRFFKRQRFNRIVWAYSKEDIDKLAKALDMRVGDKTPKLQKGEIAISRDFLTQRFFGRKEMLLEKFAPLLPSWESVRGMETTLELKRPNFSTTSIKLLKRKSGSNFVTAFSEADSIVLAEYLNLRLRHKLLPVGPKEIHITRDNLEANFNGNRARLWRCVTDLMANPESNGLTVSQRLFRRREVQVFQRRDISKMAAALHTTVRTKIVKIKFDEIAVSKSFLSMHFKTSPGALLNRAKALLPDPVGFKGNDFTAGDVTFYRRKVNNVSVWVFKEKDKHFFAKKFRARLRAEDDIDKRRLAILMDQYRPSMGDAVNVLLDPALREKIVRLRQWKIEGKEKYNEEIEKVLGGLVLGDASFYSQLLDTEKSRLQSYSNLSERIQIALMLAAVHTVEGQRVIRTNQVIRFVFDGNIATETKKGFIDGLLFLLRLRTVVHEPFTTFPRAINWVRTGVFKKAASCLLDLGGRLPDIQKDDPAKWENQIALRQLLATLEDSDVIGLLAKFTGQNSVVIRDILMELPRANEMAALEQLKVLSYAEIRQLRRPGNNGYVDVLERLAPLLYSARQQVRNEARELLAEWHRDFLGWYMGNKDLQEKAQALFYRNIINYNPYHLWENGERRVKRFDNYVRSGLTYVRHVAYAQGIPPELRSVVRAIRKHRKLMWQEKSEWPKRQELAQHLFEKGFSKDEVTGGLTWMAGMISLDDVKAGYKEDRYSRVSEESLMFESVSVANGNGNGKEQRPEDMVVDPILMIEKLREIAPETTIWVEDADDFLNLEGYSISLVHAQQLVEQHLASERKKFMAMRYDKGRFILYERSMEELKVVDKEAIEKERADAIARWRAVVQDPGHMGSQRRLEAVYQLRQAEAYSDLRELLEGNPPEGRVREEIMDALAIQNGNLVAVVYDSKIIPSIKGEALARLRRHGELEIIRSIAEEKSLPSLVRCLAIENVGEIGSLEMLVPAMEELAEGSTEVPSQREWDILIHALSKAGAYASLKRIMNNPGVDMRIQEIVLRHILESTERESSQIQMFIEDTKLPLQLRWQAIRLLGFYATPSSPDMMKVLKDIVPTIRKLIASEIEGIGDNEAAIACDVLMKSGQYPSLEKIIYDEELGHMVRACALTREISFNSQKVFDNVRDFIGKDRLPSALRLVAIQSACDRMSTAHYNPMFQEIVPIFEEWMASNPDEFLLLKANTFVDAMKNAGAYPLLKKIVCNQSLDYKLREAAVAALGFGAMDLFRASDPLEEALLGKVLEGALLADANTITPHRVKRFKILYESMREGDARSRCKEVNSIVAMMGTRMGLILNEVAAMHAARGLIRAMDWDGRIAVLHCTREITPSLAVKEFPQYEARELGDGALKNSPESILVQFRDRPEMDIDTESKGIIVPHFPMKVSFPALPSGKTLQRLRQEMNIGNRKIIVLGSPSSEDLQSFMRFYKDTYAAMPVEQRPLLIIAPRHPGDIAAYDGGDIFDSESTVMRETYLRPDGMPEPLPDMSARNILVVNTQGELFQLYGVGDISIVGQNHNIFEPASLGKPILYFGEQEQWGNNKEMLMALMQQNAVLPFSPANLLGLMNDGKAANALGAVAAKVFNQAKENWIPAAREKILDYLLPVVLWRAVLNEEATGMRLQPGAIEPVAFPEFENAA